MLKRLSVQYSGSSLATGGPKPFPKWPQFFKFDQILVYELKNLYSCMSLNFGGTKKQMYQRPLPVPVPIPLPIPGKTLLPAFGAKKINCVSESTTTELLYHFMKQVLNLSLLVHDNLRWPQKMI